MLFLSILSSAHTQKRREMEGNAGRERKSHNGVSLHLSRADVSLIAKKEINQERNEREAKNCLSR